jgi:hypothetical protein
MKTYAVPIEPVLSRHFRGESSEYGPLPLSHFSKSASLRINKIQAKYGLIKNK